MEDTFIRCGLHRINTEQYADALVSGEVEDLEVDLTLDSIQSVIDSIQESESKGNDVWKDVCSALDKGHKSIVLYAMAALGAEALPLRLLGAELYALLLSVPGAASSGVYGIWPMDRTISIVNEALNEGKDLEKELTLHLTRTAQYLARSSIRSSEQQLDQSAERLMSLFTQCIAAATWNILLHQHGIAGCKNLLSASRPYHSITISTRILARSLKPLLLLSGKNSAQVREAAFDLLDSVVELAGGADDNVRASEAAASALTALLQYCVITASDRADDRSAAVSAIVEVLLKVPASISASYIQGFLPLASKFQKVASRSIAAELSSELLLREANAPMELFETMPQLRDQLYALLIARCSDKLPTVRARSLASLGKLYLQASAGQVMGAVCRSFAVILKPAKATEEAEEEVKESEAAIVSPTPAAIIEARAAFVRLLLRRIQDEKAVVRRAGVECLAALFTSMSTEVTSSTGASSEPDQIVRAQLIHSVTSFVLCYFLQFFRFWWPAG